MAAAVSGLTARWAQQERIAENISGAGLIGHKRQIGAFATFDAALADAQAGASAAPQTIAQPNSFDLTGGPLKRTDQPLDLAIGGPGFFALQTPEGVRLTRNGHFSVNHENILVADNNYPVLGARGPLKLPPGTATVQPDGTVLVNGGAVGRLQVLAPTDPRGLQSQGDNLFAAAQTRPVAAPAVSAGTLESSNVELPKEMAGMVENQRLFDLLTRAMQTQDEELGRAIQELTS
jgi:flagellar basal-body rod protein FlgF